MSDKGKFLSNIKKSFQTKKFRGGAYITVTTVLVIGVLLLINIIFTKLDIKFDLSSQNLYSLTEDTKEYIKNVEDDITIYYLAKTGSANETYSKIVDAYGTDSKHVTVEYKDPIMYPKFASTYVNETITTDSVLVVNNNNGRVKYVDSSEFPVYEYDYSTYQQYQTGLDVEGRVTQALSYVTKEELPIIYEIEGHGETALSDTITDSLTRTNITTSSLSTVTTERIPEDCNILLINGPQTDYSEDEVNIIKDYLAAGGKAVIFVDHTAMSLANFKELLAYYGVEIVDGIIIEGNRNNYVGQYVNYLLPNMPGHEITAELKTDRKYVVIPEAKGLKEILSKRSSLTITPLLTTSDDAFSKVDLNDTTITKLDGDIDGPFNIGVEITESYNDVNTSLVVYGSPYMISDGIAASNSSYANLDLFINTINYLTGEQDSISIPQKTLSQEYVTMTSAQSMTIAVAVVIVIPLAILITGGYVCIKRRKR